MVAAAANAGVDAVKFQTFRTELFANPKDAARYERLRQFELTPAEFSRLQDLAHSLGLLFLSTPLDLESAKFLSDVVDAFKIASGDNNFFPLLGEVASTGKPMIMSTGMASLSEIDDAVSDDFDRIYEQFQDLVEAGQRPSGNRLDSESDRKHDAMQNMISRPRSLQEHLKEQFVFFDCPDIIHKFAIWRY